MSKSTKTKTAVVYCVECGAETELECICDDLNFADGARVVIDGEVYVRECE